MADNMKQFSEETKKFLAYDKAIANLKEAGLADVFIRAIVEGSRSDEGCGRS